MMAALRREKASSYDPLLPASALAVLADVEGEHSRLGKEFFHIRPHNHQIRRSVYWIRRAL